MAELTRKLARKQMLASVGLTRRVNRHLEVLQGIESTLSTAYRAGREVDDRFCRQAVESLLTARAARDPIAAMLADKLAQVRGRRPMLDPTNWAEALRVVAQSIRTHSSCRPGEIGYLTFIDAFLP